MKAKINSSIYLSRIDWWLYAIIFVCSLYFAYRVYPSADTETYTNAWFDSWSKGKIDSFRTPIYPVYLGIMLSISQEYYMFLTVLIQNIVFIISLWYLQKMLQWFTDNHIIERFAILVFAALVMSWHSLVLTESFAVSGIIFLLYNLLSLYYKGRKISIVWSTIWLAFLVFLRPAFLYLFPVCFLTYLLYYTRNHKTALMGLLSVGLVGILELGYCKRFQEKYGFFLPSEVSIENSFQIAIVEGAVSLNYTENDEVKDYLKKTSVYEGQCVYDLWNYMCTNPLPSALNTKEKAAIVSKSRKEQPGKWILACWHHYLGFVTYFFPNEERPVNFIRIIASGVMVLVNAFIILYTILCGYLVFVKKRIPVVSIILWTAVMGNLVTIIVGAQAEWYRLFLPSFPLILLMVAQLIDSRRRFLLPQS